MNVGGLCRKAHPTVMNSSPVIDNDISFNGTHNMSQFSNENLENFYLIYGTVHKPLTFIICIFGFITNIINVVVLTRRNLITPSNTLLTGMSLAQLFLVFNYLTLISFNSLAENCIVPAFLESYAWMMFKLINVNLSVAFHTTALIHTMCLTIFRFCAVKLPQFSRSSLKQASAKKCVIALYIAVPLLCFPTFFTTRVELIKERHLSCKNVWTYYDLMFVSSEEVLQATLWTFGVVLKLIPGLTIGVLSFHLIHSLRSIDDRSEKLTGSVNARRKLHQQRVTKMLLAVSLLCISVEVPHGIVNVLTGIFGKEFGIGVYDNLGEFFEMLTLLYSSVNFLLYCFMSTEFQTTFKLLCSRCFACFCTNIRRLFEFCPVFGIARNKIQNNCSKSYISVTVTKDDVLV